MICEFLTHQVLLSHRLKVDPVEKWQLVHIPVPPAKKQQNKRFNAFFLSNYTKQLWPTNPFARFELESNH